MNPEQELLPAGFPQYSLERQSEALPLLFYRQHPLNSLPRWRGAERERRANRRVRRKPSGSDPRSYPQHAIREDPTGRRTVTAHCQRCGQNSASVGNDGSFFSSIWSRLIHPRRPPGGTESSGKRPPTSPRHPPIHLSRTRSTARSEYPATHHPAKMMDWPRERRRRDVKMGASGRPELSASG